MDNRHFNNVTILKLKKKKRKKRKEKENLLQIFWASNLQKFNI
jgi:uncharacterized protein (UPF0335 family)